MSLPLIIETKIRVLHIKVGPTKFYISNFIFTISNFTSANKRSAKC